MAKARRQSNEELEARLIALENSENTILYQIKTLSTDISSAQTIADLTFNNLEIGKTYRVSLQAWVGSLGTPEATAAVAITHDGTTIGRALHHMGGASTQNEDNEHSTVVVFEATATTLTFVFSESGSGVCYGNGTQSETFAILEELPQHVPTSQWT